MGGLLRAKTRTAFLKPAILQQFKPNKQSLPSFCTHEHTQQWPWCPEQLLSVKTKVLGSPKGFYWCSQTHFSGVPQSPAQPDWTQWAFGSSPSTPGSSTALTAEFPEHVITCACTPQCTNSSWQCKMKGELYMQSRGKILCPPPTQKLKNCPRNTTQSCKCTRD